MKYHLAEPPNNPGQIGEYLSRELRSIETVIAVPTVVVEISASASYSGQPSSGFTIEHAYINADREFVVVYRAKP